MLDLIIKYGLLFAFFGVMLFVGFYCRRHATNVNDFVLGGRSVGPWLTAFAYGTSYFSAVVFVGYAGQFGWKYGIAATWAGVGNAILGSLLAWLVLGRRTRIMTQHLGSATMPQFFDQRFQSKGLKIAASAIIFIFLIPYTASLYNGLSRLFGMAFRVDYSICVLVMAVLTCIYVIAGGYMATAINDFIQGLIMLGGIVAVIVAILHSKGGLTTAIESLRAVSDPMVADGKAGVFASLFGPDPLGLLGVVILTSLGTWGLPQMVQKFYAIKDEQAIVKGTVISTLFALVVAGGCYFLGGFGRLFADKIDLAAGGYDSIIPSMLEGLPVVLIAIVVILVLSASMSTLSSLVLTSSSTLTLDFLADGLKIKLSERRKMLTMRSLIVVFIAISAGIAILQYKSGITFIAQLMGISWGTLAGAFLAPFLYGLYWKRTTKTACFVCFAFSAGFMLANIFFGKYFPAWLASPINAGAFCMLAGLILVPLVSLLTKPPHAQQIQHIFSCFAKEKTTDHSTSEECIL